LVHIFKFFQARLLEGVSDIYSVRLEVIFAWGKLNSPSELRDEFLDQRQSKNQESCFSCSMGINSTTEWKNSQRLSLIPELG
jgi:hypothetical protein